MKRVVESSARQTITTSSSSSSSSSSTQLNSGQNRRSAYMHAAYSTLPHTQFTNSVPNPLPRLSATSGGGTTTTAARVRTGSTSTDVSIEAPSIQVSTIPSSNA
jgi:hypothetical protein